MLEVIGPWGIYHIVVNIRGTCIHPILICKVYMDEWVGHDLGQLGMHSGTN